MLLLVTAEKPYKINEFNTWVLIYIYLEDNMAHNRRERENDIYMCTDSIKELKKIFIYLAVVCTLVCVHCVVERS